MSRVFISEEIVGVGSKLSSCISPLESDSSDGSEYSSGVSMGLILEWVEIGAEVYGGGASAAVLAGGGGVGGLRCILQPWAHRWYHHPVAKPVGYQPFPPLVS